MDSSSLISAVLSVRETATASDRQIAVAANVARTERANVATLLQAIESSAYGSGGQLSAAPVTGSHLSSHA